MDAADRRRYGKFAHRKGLLAELTKEEMEQIDAALTFDAKPKIGVWRCPGRNLCACGAELGQLVAALDTGRQMFLYVPLRHRIDFIVEKRNE